MLRDVCRASGGALGSDSLGAAWHELAAALPLLNHLPAARHPVCLLLLLRVCLLLALPSHSDNATADEADGVVQAIVDAVLGTGKPGRTTGASAVHGVSLTEAARVHLANCCLLMGWCYHHVQRQQEPTGASTMGAVAVAHVLPVLIQAVDEHLGQTGATRASAGVSQSLRRMALTCLEEGTLPGSIGKEMFMSPGVYAQLRSFAACSRNVPHAHR